MRRSFLKYLSDVFMIYGLTIVILNIFCILFGGGARGFSSLFSLGADGLAVSTAFEFLLTIASVVLIKYIFMTDMIIKDMKITARIVLMFASAFALTCVYIIIFRWFPVDMPVTWILFILCFAVSCTVSWFISMTSEKQENRRLEEALKKYKEEEK